MQTASLIGATGLVDSCARLYSAPIMTKYVGESISVRSGRNSTAVVGKDRKKSMQVFLATGRHPLIEHTRMENKDSVLSPLPTVDHNRPHVFMDLLQRTRSGASGRLVIEMFEDIFPAACAAFRNRCQEVRHTILFIPLVACLRNDLCAL